MPIATLRLRWVAAATLPFACAVHAQVSVIEPDGVNDAVSAGDDFATQVVGDPWDMSESTDIEMYYSDGMTNESVSGGQYHGTSTGTGPRFYVQHPGISSTLDLSRGVRFPVATSYYRYLTVKLRASTAQPPALLGYFFKDKEWPLTNNFGYSGFASYAANQWQIVTLDLATSNGGGPHAWTDFATVHGIAVSPVNIANTPVDVDWVRLTAAPTPANRYTVIWSDSVSGSYTVTAIDVDGARFVLGTGISATSFAADLSRLAPGNYAIEVARSGSSAVSAGPLHINDPPRPRVTAPSVRGEQSRSYAQVELGNPWGPMDVADVQNSNFALGSVSYSNPAGTFYARPKDGDPWIQLKTAGHPINATLYRSLCFTMEVYGAPPLLFNSVARVYFGNTFGTMNPTQDILVGRGSTEYCIEDMSAAELEPGATTPWAGSINLLRLDPHEYSVSAACVSTPSASECHDVRLSSLVLAPFASAAPVYTFQWDVTDTDSSAAGVALYLDADRTFNNGNEFVIGTPNTLGTSQQLQWSAPPSVPNGKYYLAVLATDGLNTTVQYSGGPVLVTFVDLIFKNGFE